MVSKPLHLGPTPGRPRAGPDPDRLEFDGQAGGVMAGEVLVLHSVGGELRQKGRRRRSKLQQPSKMQARVTDGEWADSHTHT